MILMGPLLFVGFLSWHGHTKSDHLLEFQRPLRDLGVLVPLLRHKFVRVRHSLILKLDVTDMEFSHLKKISHIWLGMEVSIIVNRKSLACRGFEPLFTNFMICGSMIAV